MARSYIVCGFTGSDVHSVCCGSDVHVRQDVGQRELVFPVVAGIDSVFCVSMQSDMLSGMICQLFVSVVLSA
eukprot:382657-Ditylum_brightwellii.AAC.1